MFDHPPFPHPFLILRMSIMFLTVNIFQTCIFLTGDKNANHLAHRISEWLVYTGQGTFSESVSFVLEFFSLLQKVSISPTIFIANFT